MSVTSPAIRYHGAKFRLANWVMQFFPPHRCYVEPYGGAAGVLLQKPRSYAEVYNDLDGDIVNFFAVLRDPADRAKLIEACTLTPYARDEFDLAWEPTADRIERARRLAVRAQMGFGSAGATKGKTGFRIDTRRKYGTSQQLWVEYPEALQAAGQRLTGVMIENRPAIDLLRQHDTPDTLFFVDPPYMHETRVMQNGNRGYYRHEMSDVDHDELLTVLLELQGCVVLTGYESALYKRRLSAWEHHHTSARIAAARGAGTRIEHAWLNPACVAYLQRRTGLFEVVA
jgi:DNA adenine methylase